MKAVLLLIIAILIAVILGGGYYLFFQDSPEKQQEKVYEGLKEYNALYEKNKKIDCSKQKEVSELYDDGNGDIEKLKEILNEEVECFDKVVAENIDSDTKISKVLESIDCKNIKQFENCQEVKDNFPDVIKYKNRIFKEYKGYQNDMYDYVVCSYKNEDDCEQPDDFSEIENDVDLDEKLEMIQESLIDTYKNWNK